MGSLSFAKMRANKKGIGEKHVPIIIVGTRICYGSVCISETGDEKPGVAKNNRCNLAEEPRKSLTVEENNHAQMEL
uniref:Uncharacterized protein n=1 Tax=Solanum lycopersicum TaxID=4081 RepID=K4AU73_SOLLC